MKYNKPDQWLQAECGNQSQFPLLSQCVSQALLPLLPQTTEAVPTVLLSMSEL